MLSANNTDLSMFRRIILAILLMTPSVASAEDIGKFSTLAINELAPFEGVLFDPTAVANILALAEIVPASCDLEVEYNLDKQATEFQLERKELTLRLESLTHEYNLTITQKDLEINQLQKIIKSQSPRNNWIWYVGGIVSGAVISYGAYSIFN